MYLHFVPKKGYKKVSVLLREGHRIGCKVINETIANLSNHSALQIQKIKELLEWRRLLRDTSLVPQLDFEIAQLLGDKLTFRTGFTTAKKLDKRFKPPRLR